MIKYLFIIAFLAIGFIILHFAEKENSKKLKLAGFITLGGSALVIVAMIYFMLFGACSGRRGCSKKYKGNHYSKHYSKHDCKKGDCKGDSCPYSKKKSTAKLK